MQLSLVAGRQADEAKAILKLVGRCKDGMDQVDEMCSGLSGKLGTAVSEVPDYPMLRKVGVAFFVPALYILIISRSSPNLLSEFTHAPLQACALAFAAHWLGCRQKSQGCVIYLSRMCDLPIKDV